MSLSTYSERIDRSRLLVGHVAAVGLAVLAFLYIVALTRLAGMPAKWLVVLSLVAASPVVLTVFRPRREAALALLTLTLALPSFDFNLFYNPAQGGDYRLNIALLDLVVLALLGRWLWLALGRKSFETRVSAFSLGCFLTLALVAGLSLLWAPNPGLGAFELVRLVKMILLALVTAHFVRSERDVRMILWTLLGVLLLEGGIALLQQFRGAGVGLTLLGEQEALVMQELGRTTQSRVSGTLRHANRLAMFLGFFLPAAVALSVGPGSRTTRRLRFVALAALLVGGIALLYTLSRAGWLAFALSTLVVVGLLRRQSRGNQRLLRGGVAGLLVLAAVIGMNRDIIRERMISNDHGSFNSRIPLAQVALSITRDHPVWGSGIGNYREWLPRYHIPGEPFTEIAKVHNVFLLVVAEMGLVGVGVFLLLLAGTFRRLWRSFRHQHGMSQALAVAVLGGMVAFFLHGQADYVEISRIAPLWFAIGLSEALPRIRTATADSQ